MPRYVEGDFRFRTGFCKSNPRKMVKLWAEKEFRNLARLKAAGIRSPRPVHLRMHVLVMEFVGAHGVAAPRLKVSLIPAISACCCGSLKKLYRRPSDGSRASNSAGLLGIACRLAGGKSEGGFDTLQWCADMRGECRMQRSPWNSSSHTTHSWFC